MSGALRLPRSILDAIRAHGRETYPHECCGFLLGAPQAGEAVELLRASNAREDSPQNRYLIPPVEFVRAQRDADQRGLDIVGFYHSHPDHPARPSAFDRDHAWPGYAYLIAEVRGGEPLDLRGFRLETVGGVFHEISLEEA
ncbi:MAG: M67 family metallopeptidase [Candidatus Eisenbacteria bacterium]